jgi:hypothetical protein
MARMPRVFPCGEGDPDMSHIDCRSGPYLRRSHLPPWPLLGLVAALLLSLAVPPPTLAQSPTPDASASPADGQDDIAARARALWSRARDAARNQLPRVEELMKQFPAEMRDLQGWEYQVLEVKDGGPVETMQDDLNRLGQEGWECFAIAPARDRTRCLLKRRKLGMVRYLMLLKSLHLVGPD